MTKKQIEELKYHKQSVELFEKMRINFDQKMNKKNFQKGMVIHHKLRPMDSIDSLFSNIWSIFRTDSLFNS